MDKKTIVAFLIIGLIIILTPYYMDLITPESVKKERMEQQKRLQAVRDSIKKTQEVVSSGKEEKKEEEITDKTEKKNIKTDKKFTENEERTVNIETPLYSAKIITRGATVESWILKKYKHRNGNPYDLIKYNKGNLAISYTDIDDNEIDTKDWVYNIKGFENSKGDININLTDGTQQKTVEFFIDLGNEKIIRKKYRFSNNSYTIDFSVILENMDQYIDGRKYELYWGGGIRYSELENKDASYAKSYVLLGDEEREVIDANKKNSEKETEFTGRTKWVAMRTKYFSVAIIPDRDAAKGARVIPYYEKNDDLIEYKSYNTGLIIDFKDTDYQENRLQVFMGPNDYEIIKSFGVKLEKMMDFGWKFIRPISKIIYKTLEFINGIIPNYGVNIIILAVILKLLFHPLTVKSYKSMREMSELQPKLKELKEKYKDNPQKLNKATMQLYKEHGVNPLGGCIPTMLQMPVFFALYPVFRTFIEFRGAKFFGWINDLSQGDTLFHLPFNLPMYGNEFNLLPLIWGASMFVQQKLTMKDPKQSAMVYVMPIVMVLFFNRLSSGLVLYWLTFNLLSLAHQKLIGIKDKSKKE